jgi:hypothetical protein
MIFSEETGFKARPRIGIVLTDGVGACDPRPGRWKYTCRRLVTALLAPGLAMSPRSGGALSVKAGVSFVLHVAVVEGLIAEVHPDRGGMRRAAGHTATVAAARPTRITDR